MRKLIRRDGFRSFALYLPKWKTSQSYSSTRHRNVMPRSFLTHITGNDYLRSLLNAGTTCRREQISRSSADNGLNESGYPLRTGVPTARILSIASPTARVISKAFGPLDCHRYALAPQDRPTRTQNGLRTWIAS